jgi:hypothetical protein
VYQKNAIHPLSTDLPPLDIEVFSVLWEIFEQIGMFWRNMDNPAPYKLHVYTFLLNRIKLRPVYRQYYHSAPGVITALKEQYRIDKAYEFLFTDPSINTFPPQTDVAVVRQNIVNELIPYQLALGGFKAFGAVNYCGYIGGSYIEHREPPYRTFEDAK